MRETVIGKRAGSLTMDAAPMENARREARYVYFIQADAIGLIKIGIANDMRHRMFNLQTGSPVRLRLLGVIETSRARHLEPELHDRFWQFRAHGEWFRPGEPLLKFIAAETTHDDSVNNDEMWAEVEAVNAILRERQAVGLSKSDLFAHSPYREPAPRKRPDPKVSGKAALRAYKAARGLAQ